jgi:hypothetical protein
MKRNEIEADLPPHCRLGDNANAFKGGFSMWVDSARETRLASLSEAT